MAPDYDHLTLMQKVEVFEHALENTNGDDLAKILWFKSQSSEVSLRLCLWRYLTGDVLWLVIYMCTLIQAELNNLIKCEILYSYLQIRHFVSRGTSSELY